MGTVVPAVKPFVVADASYQPLGFTQRVTDPAIYFSFVLFYVKFCSVCPAKTLQQLALYLVVNKKVGVINIIELVFKILVVNLDQSFEHILLKIPEISQASLVGY